MTSTSRRLKMLHDLVQAKKGHQSASGKGTNRPSNRNNSSDMLSNNNSVFTCIGLGKRTEKSSQSDQQQQQEVKNLHVDLKTEVVQNTIDCSQPRLPFYHTCHQPGHKMGVCEGNLVLPQATEWDRFESLIQELDRKESDLPPTTFAASTKDIQSTEDQLTIFGKLATPTEPPPFMKTQHNASPLSGSKLSQRQTADSPRPDMRPIETTAEKKITTAICVDTQKPEAKKRESGVMRILTEGRKLSSNSMESLYSRQSSSSGVTSDCSSNRDSLRLEDESFCPRLFCGRARVHTEFMPSPYDTESLKLKVGDVIDIIHKRPMGIWTGMLNNKIGNFKFIYVDEKAAPETHEEVQNHRAPQKCTSTIHEVLRRLSLEEYSSSLQQNGYQTVDDLMRLREHHLTKLQVTDPEHRRRLLAAVESLQELSSTCDLEKEPKQEVGTPTENMKRDMRDSGCHMPSDSTDISGEDADLHFP
ncbi:SAM domain-containing protein SAMSN-1-like [Hippocampus comes]|uniref:SAM domain-containing protein SAMSN-1-like n=1 Tax=Hippocampus comes TaxID=109280 RepID=UPI00094E7EDC|nr:PREDICTED: SAM domain-containing protein SAMSN-1-like [Hippocampus comes]